MGQQIARQFGTGQQQGEGEDGRTGRTARTARPARATAARQNRDGQTTGPRPGDAAAARPPPLRPPRPARPPAAARARPGADESGDVRVPDQMEQARTREIQEELRRRGADRTRPQPELDYIDRLLKPF